MKNKQQFWKKHITAWKGSGLSQAEYCRKHDIPVKTFGYHKRRMTSAAKPQKIIAVPATAAILADKSQSGKSIKLHLPMGLHIEIAPDFCQQTLKRLLEVVV
ncbi:IS66 family insertion sequence element accessory protein TnpA [Maridesulfovibrio sp.]|uniref:IS66 family insertion sequence element accessory protein TnpA n=1 Tax=Maridesulfovibrio sp. TaxID=2795000 RepID=UPI0039F0A8F8